MTCKVLLIRPTYRRGKFNDISRTLQKLFESRLLQACAISTQNSTAERPWKLLFSSDSDHIHGDRRNPMGPDRSAVEFCLK